jgi:hypothetical protein
MSTAASHCDRIIDMIDTCLAEYERALVSSSRPRAGAAFEASAPRVPTTAAVGRDATRLLVAAGLRLA